MIERINTATSKQNVESPIANLASVRPYAIMGWLWFIGTLVPVIGLMQVGDQAYADRYMYTPLQVRSWKDSFSLFERALVISPGAAFPHVRLGMINAMQGQFEKAQGHFDLAFERDATQAVVVVRQLESMAASLASGGRFAAAIGRMELAVLVAVKNGEEARGEALAARLAQYRKAQRLALNGSR